MNTRMGLVSRTLPVHLMKVHSVAAYNAFGYSEPSATTGRFFFSEKNGCKEYLL